MSYTPVTTGAPAMGGNPDNLESYASDYEDAATTIRDAATNLLSIADDDQFVSLAINEVATKVSEAAGETEQIAVRFEGAAAALAVYAKSLRNARSKASTATSDFEYAVGRFDFWDNKVTEISDDIRNGVGDVAQLTTDLTYANGRVTHWRGMVHTAEANSTTAFSDLDDAADIAIAAIDAAMAASSLNDSFADDWNGFWEGVYEWCQEYLTPILEVIAELAELMSTIAGWIALALTVASVFLGPLGAATLALAGTISLIGLGLLAVSVLATAALMFLGKVSLAEFTGKLINLTISFALSKLGPLGGPLKAGAANLADDAARALPGYLAGAPVFGETLYDVIKGVGGPVIEKVVKDSVKALGQEAYQLSPTFDATTPVDLYPDAGGPDWNPPPIPQITSLSSDNPGVLINMDQTAAVCTPS